MTTTAPTIRIRDTQQPRKKKPTQHRAPALSLSQTSMEIASLKETIERLKKSIETLPRHAVRNSVNRLMATPERYLTELTLAEFYSRAKPDVKFFEPYSHPEDDYEEHPALVRITWQAGGHIYGLNPTEHDLLLKHFKVQDDDGDATYDRQSPFYLLWLQKDPVSLWFTLRQDDVKGFAWCCCVADHIREVRNQDKVRWQAVVKVANSYLHMAPEEKNDLQSMVRESQMMFMMDDKIRGTLPWEVRTDPLVQAALAKLRTEAYRTLQTGEEYQAQVMAERALLDTAVAEELTVVEKRF